MAQSKDKEDNGASKQEINIEDLVPSKEEIEEGFDEAKVNSAWDEVQNQLENNLTIAFVGTMKVGKTSAINALFSKDLGDAHPIPGSTDKVKVFSLSNNVIVADTPGLGDIREEVSEKSLEACKDIDLFVYLLNAKAGLKKQEKDDIENIKEMGKPLLIVFNKIDLLRPDEKDVVIEKQIENLNIPKKDIICAAVDPDPKIAKQPINLDKIQGWILNTLEKEGKDLLFAVEVKNKKKIVDSYINWGAGQAVAAGALPIPGSDYGTLTAIQIRMIIKIGKVYGHSPTPEDVKVIIVQTMAGQAGLRVFKGIISLLKGAGWFGGPLGTAAVSGLAASIAGSVTYSLGKVAKAYYRSDEQISKDKMAEIFEKSYKEKQNEKGN